MKTTLKAIERAKEKYDDKKDYDFCIAQKVCPKCAGDLDLTKTTHGSYGEPSTSLPATLNYKCTNLKCDFKHSE